MEIPNFRSQNSKTPEPTDEKYGVGDNVGDDSPHTKIQNDRPVGGISARVKYHLAWFLVFFPFLFV